MNNLAMVIAMARRRRIKRKRSKRGQNILQAIAKAQAKANWGRKFAKFLGQQY